MAGGRRPAERFSAARRDPLSSAFRRLASDRSMPPNLLRRRSWLELGKLRGTSGDEADSRRRQSSGASRRRVAPETYTLDALVFRRWPAGGISTALWWSSGGSASDSAGTSRPARPEEGMMAPVMILVLHVVWDAALGATFGGFRRSAGQG